MGIAVGIQKEKRVYQQTRWGEIGSKKRASWGELGISKERRRELREIAKRDEYADIVTGIALKVDQASAGHIILSVVKGLPYERVEFVDGLGRIPCGKTDFYGYRRLFFYYLDEFLKGRDESHG